MIVSIHSGNSYIFAVFSLRFIVSWISKFSMEENLRDIMDLLKEIFDRLLQWFTEPDNFLPLLILMLLLLIFLFGIIVHGFMWGCYEISRWIQKLVKRKKTYLFDENWPHHNDRSDSYPACCNKKWEIHDLSCEICWKMRFHV